MKRVRVNGEVVRKEREKRAWTQEELSERSQLGVRTLRRLEAGQGSLESLQRVSQALELQPEVAASSWRARRSLPDTAWNRSRNLGGEEGGKAGPKKIGAYDG